jgi:hypothetical protein
MKETSDTANQFLGRFLFGGLVAVIALLNVDLVVLHGVATFTPRVAVMLGGMGGLVLLLSWFYFRVVVEHYTNFRVSHRKLKYKYELTLHALLSGADPTSYARMLEEKVDRRPVEGFDDAYPSGVAPHFVRIAEYLREHHRKAWCGIVHGEGSDGRRFQQLAMTLVVLTMAIRGLALVASHTEQRVGTIGSTSGETATSTRDSVRPIGDHGSSPTTESRTRP